MLIVVLIFISGLLNLMLGSTALKTSGPLPSMVCTTTGVSQRAISYYT